NAAAVSQMFAFRIAWGGSMALHARVFRHPAVLWRWSRSFAEDAGMFGLVRELGQELRFVPEVTVINPETIELPGCWTFIRRQLFVARVQTGWRQRLGMIHAAIILALVAACGLLAAGLWTRTWTWALGAGGLLGLYAGGLLAALLVVERCIRKGAQRRGEAVP